MCVCKDTSGILGITKGCLKTELGNACLLVVSIFNSTAKQKLEAQVKMFLHLKHVEIQVFFYQTLPYRMVPAQSLSPAVPGLFSQSDQLI